MALQIIGAKDQKSMHEIKLDRPLYTAADRLTVVEKGDPRAAYVIGGKGSTVSGPDVERLGLKIVEGKVTYPGNVYGPTETAPVSLEVVEAQKDAAASDMGTHAAPPQEPATDPLQSEQTSQEQEMTYERAKQLAKELGINPVGKSKEKLIEAVAKAVAGPDNTKHVAGPQENK